MMTSSVSIFVMLLVLAAWIVGIFVTVVVIQMLLMVRKILKWYMKKNDIV